jgi:calcium/calmodulin-dependent protein kinase I
VSGGELFDRIVEKTFYTEKEARDLVKILLSAIKYCHDKDVVHRDLKPENLLLMSADDDASIKLADFGFAKTVTKDDAGLVTTCGTPGYVAPEILEGTAYGKPVDIWSIGVITYILLAGYPPFHDDSQPILFRKIRKGKYQYDSPYWDNVSDDAKDFISRMLVVDPKNRAAASDLLEHRWIMDKDVATVPLTSALTELRRFHARKKFKAAVHSVQAINSMNKALSSSSSSLSSDTASHNKLRVSDSEVSL